MMAQDRVRRARQAKAKLMVAKAKAKVATRKHGRHSKGKDSIVALDRALKWRGEFVLGVFLGPRHGGGSGLQWLAQASSNVLWEKPIWECVWPYSDQWDTLCVFTHSIRGVECAREVRAAWRALFLPDCRRSRRRCWVARPLAPFFAADIRTPFFLC